MADTRSEPLALVSLEVRAALEQEKPVVALESTVIAQGLPAPRNLEAARDLETAVRSRGAVPATVAVIAGRPRIGLDSAEMELLADGRAKVEKLSTRDLPVALARKSTGSTTVAATAWLARTVGIDVFATGGIGGVHRGGAGDVSADLLELSRTPIIVVCAGAKAILDLPATREALEALGILVLGFRTDELPAFYSRSSGLPVDARVDSAAEVAAVWESHRMLGAAGAILLVAPIPEEAEIPAREIEGYIGRALLQAEEEGLRGKAVTPFLLGHLAAATEGRSVDANIALLRNNAAIAGEVARAIHGA